MQHILIPVALDHEGLVGKKLDLSRRLLADGGRITLLTVLESIPGYVAEFIDQKPEHHLTDRIRQKLREAAGDDPAIACEVVTGKAGVEIASFARSHRVELIVIGSHHPSAQDYFLGSTAARVARRAPCSVMVVR